MPQTDCLISLGANLGGRQAALRAAVTRLADDPSITKLHVSSLYETAPIGGPEGQQAFLNAAARFATSHTASGLLHRLQSVEAELGRERGQRWAARTLDLDLLLFGEETIETAVLAVPHPRLAFRRFVLEPAAEIAAAWVHPPTMLPLHELLARLDEQPVEIAVKAASAALAARLVKMVQPVAVSQAARVTIASERATAGRPPTLLVWLQAGDDANKPLQPAPGVPALIVPGNDLARAEAEITAALAAISDRPRKLPVSDAWPPPVDRR